MRRTGLTIIAASFAAALALPAVAQEQPVKGKEAVEIVAKGTIRASSNQGFQGFLFLIEYKGRNYTCSVAATGQVQDCFPLYW